MGTPIKEGSLESDSKEETIICKDV